MSEILFDTLYRFNDWWFTLMGPGGLLAFGAICSLATSVLYDVAKAYARRRAARSASRHPVRLLYAARRREEVA